MSAPHMAGSARRTMWASTVTAPGADPDAYNEPVSALLASPRFIVSTSEALKVSSICPSKYRIKELSNKAADSANPRFF